MNTLQSISPLDGRYSDKVSELSNYFSEYALIKYRVLVEIEWFIFLCNELKLDNSRILKKDEIKKLKAIYQEFEFKDAQEVKNIEKVTNHDVKAVEYFLKEKFKNLKLDNLSEFIHFACTSEDITNLAYSLMIKESLSNVINSNLEKILENLRLKANIYKKMPMLSRTHGQSATPTTLGKEFIIFISRIERQIKNTKIEFLGKINGAVGNYNAHLSAYPKIDWIKASEKFIKSLSLTPNFYTTQIESHDFIAEIFHYFQRINTVLLDMCRDIWTYVSLDYFKQKLKEGEVGSSTMPHKVNPIDFENAEGNLGLANAIFQHLAEKLPISRMQRDLTDSTVLRNTGVAFAYSLIAYKSILKGLSKLDVNEKKMLIDLDNNWEILAEPIQTVMRKYKVEKPYEKLKELTRGKKLDNKAISDFISKLEIPAAAKKNLLNLTPAKYVGLAEKLVLKYLKG